MELLVVIAIIGLLVGLAVPALGRVRNKTGSIRELAALRGVITAWNHYATDQKGWLLPGFYGMAPLNPLPAFYEDGEPIPADVYGSHRAVVARWPYRLSKYLDHDAHHLAIDSELSQVDECSRGDLMKKLYFGSLYPAFGMNTMWVGGDQERYGFMDSDMGGRPNPFYKFYASRLSGIKHPERIIVFASSRTNQNACGSGAVREGYFRLESPQWLGPQWNTQYDDTLANSSGNVSARWHDQSAVATVNGGVELVPMDQLRDMRRWADQATTSDWKFRPR